MTEKITDLSQVRSKRMPPQQQWEIPLAHRITGFEFDEVHGDTAKRKVPSKRPIKPRYTLYSGDIDYSDIANAAIDPITRLDPAIDTGWVVVRQHANHDRAYGYAQKEVDLFMTDRGLPSSLIFDTTNGPHTLTHYPFITRTPPLLIYVRTFPGVGIVELVESDVCANQYAIYFPDGSISNDPALLYEAGK